MKGYSKYSKYKFVTDYDRENIERNLLRFIEDESGLTTRDFSLIEPFTNSEVSELDLSLAVESLEKEHSITIEPPDAMVMGHREIPGFFGLFTSSEQIYKGDCWGEVASYCLLSFKELVQRALDELEQKKRTDSEENSKTLKKLVTKP
jgi:hypothetical protein